MANKDKPTTVTEAPEAEVIERKVTGKVTNQRAIVFPFDQHGFTTLLRKEGVRAVGRIKGDKGKMDIFLNTLRVLGEHAKAKIEDQVKDTAQKAAAAQNRADAEYSRSLADQKAEVKRLEAVLASAKAAVAAKEAMPGEVDADE